MATRSKKEDRRQRILDAAVAVFARRGFDRARVSEVAKTAGVADGTIYLYFENKDDLLIRLFEERITPLIQELDDHVRASSDDPRRQLHALALSYLEGVGNDPLLAALITTQVRQSHEFMTAYSNEPLRRFLAIIERIFKSGQDRGYFRRDIHISTLRWLVFGALDAFALAWITGGRQQKSVLAQDAEQLAAVLLRGLGTGEQPSLIPQDTAVDIRPARAEPVSDFDPGLD